jgi:hypothetical protein
MFETINQYYILLIIYTYIYTSRWYVRNYVIAVRQGADHSKRVIVQTFCFFKGNYKVGPPR